MVAKKLLGREAGNIIRKLIEMALDGDSAAMRLCMERIYPKPKDAAIKATLPEINQFSDIPVAIGQIFQMIGGGHFTIEQGKALASIVASQGNILEMAELEKRLSALEERCSNEGKSDKTN